MRVVLSTIGRFHSFDLARQLERSGALTAIYTGYPRFKLGDTGVAPALIRPFPWLQAPYMALIRHAWFRRTLEMRWARAANVAHDRHVARTLPDCDLVCVLSGAGVATAGEAKRRGIAYVCDRGSTHIRHQDRVLAEEHERLGLPWRGVDPVMIEREEVEYAAADMITVPTRFVRETFLARGVPASRVAVAPYGADVRIFGRTAGRDPDFRVLFAGQLDVRKGLHDLLAGFRRAALPRATLVLAGTAQRHTGALLQRFPVERLEVLGHLSRPELAREMARASVLVLPSLEEGMALVQAQALACGCPVVATREAGAEDLFDDGVEGFIVPARDPGAIAERLVRLATEPGLLDRMSAAAAARIGSIGSWDAYGLRILDIYRELLARPRAAAAGA